MSLIFLEPARDELDEAAAHYDRERAGLGDEFSEEATNAIQRIMRFPGAWTALSDTVRRCRLNRFPYGIVYTVRGEDIIILAVMHLRRKPGYWQDRL